LLSGGTIECNRDYLNFSGFYTDIASFGRTICALSTGGQVECQGFPGSSIASLPDTANGNTYVSLFSGQGLCAIDTVGEVSCTEAVNTPGSISGPSSNFTPLPTVAPEKPDAIDDLSASVYSDSTIELMWTTFRIGGDGRVVGAEIYRNGELLVRTDQSSSYVDRTLEPGLDYSYDVRIINNRGDVGPSSNIIIVNTINRSTTNDSSYTRPSRMAAISNLSALIYSDAALELVANAWFRLSLRRISR